MAKLVDVANVTIIVMSPLGDRKELPTCWPGVRLPFLSAHSVITVSATKPCFITQKIIQWTKRKTQATWEKLRRSLYAWVERSESQMPVPMASTTLHRQFHSREQSWGVTAWSCPCITACSDVSQDSRSHLSISSIVFQSWKYSGTTYFRYGRVM